MFCIFITPCFDQEHNLHNRPENRLANSSFNAILWFSDNLHSLLHHYSLLIILVGKGAHRFSLYAKNPHNMQGHQSFSHSFKGGGHLYLKLDIILVLKKNHVIRVVFSGQTMYVSTVNVLGVQKLRTKTCKIWENCVFLVMFTNSGKRHARTRI